jgi:hypothetical protein
MLLSQLLPAAVLAVVVVWLIRDQRKPASLLRALQRELRPHLAVFSAETVRGKEADFIRERLTRRVPRMLLFMLGAFGVMLVAAWWLTR